MGRFVVKRLAVMKITALIILMILLVLVVAVKADESRFPPLPAASTSTPSVRQFSDPLPPCHPSDLTPCDDGLINRSGGKHGKRGTFKYCFKWARDHCRRQTSSRAYRDCVTQKLAICLSKFQNPKSGKVDFKLYP